ncbi:MAG: adenosylmethionine-8-amino-7-oxononanoate transaminase [Candidatus Saganbacteria bacterium]|uniref:Adenosylmethionine-8-amino-7-oxononanoate aminotransferase n=1 Tax=Candidatus Saganbacteria bacterium TaxID=2575572 RepID=A0A833KZP0_UNCSA|nr:MAG: adenosylmethionine-8-amino-7-oxononanoate transaminase [Candidatus Saganbacteria bacterium]
MKNLNNLDKQYIWHPFTQMKDWLKDKQLIIEKGKGIYLYDDKGNEYIDGVSSLWVTVHGHQKKEIDQAIKKQLKKISHSTLLGLGNEPSAILAEKLIKIAPAGLKKVFYSDSGSTAVEIALKIAFQYQKLRGKKSKTKFITLENAYHGDTIGSVSVGGIDLFHELYKPMLFKSFKVPVDNILKLEQLLKAKHQTIAAMIVEPMVQAAAGMLIMPKGFLESARKLCKKYNVILICDEVAAGFGRTGKMFASENISPDIICVAKGITGGYLPLAATLTTEKIFDAFIGDKSKTFFHGHTYTGNPLSCAAAIANLDIFEKENTLEKLKAKIEFLREKLDKYKNLKQIKEIRQLGFMVGIELNSEKAGLGREVILEARKRGVIIRPLGNVIVLMPPLSISLKELQKLVKITFESIQAAMRM